MRQILLVFAITLSGCASLMPPKTSSEFRKWCKAEGGMTTVTVNAPLETVISRINAHAPRCTSFGWTTTRTEGMGGNPAPSKYSDRYLIRWEKSGTDKPTFIVALEGAQDLNQQKGGFFVHVIDLERKGAQTKVNLYYPNVWGYYDHNKEYKAVVQGIKATCQFEEAKK